MQIIAGIDGGGTHTRAVLADATGRIIGFGTAGPSNCGNVSFEEIQKNIKMALVQAFKQTDKDSQSLKAIFLGIAGVVGSEDRSIIRKIVEDYKFIHPEYIEVDHDIRISLAGGLAGQEGIALIVGTGSSCYGRTSEGQDWMAGGWGHLLDDRGSAYDLARRGLIAVIQAADGRSAKTELAKALMHELNISRIHQIMHRIYVEGPSGHPMDKKEIAALATVVTEVADGGDAVALQIIREGIHELVRMVKAVIHHLNFLSSQIPLVISGGAARGSSLIRKELYNTLTSSIPEIKIKEPILSPIEGSVLLALKMIDVNIDKNITANLKQAKYSKV